MDDYRYEQAYADWQAELRAAARRPERWAPSAVRPRRTRGAGRSVGAARRWFRRVVTARC